MVPGGIVERVRSLCLALPEVTVRVDESRTTARSEAQAFDIRRRPFCLLVAVADPSGEPVPLLVLFATWAILRSLARDSHAAPFLLALLLMFLGYTGLAISLWPHIVPPAISIWDAAAPRQSMSFTLVGALFIIPFILGYTAWSYYVFRGKVRLGEGYH